MPSSQDHVKSAKRFRDLYDAIPAEHVEGRVLALFYSALHHIESVAGSETPSRHNKNHAERREWIMKSYPKMWKFFQPLWQESERVRYLLAGGCHLAPSAVEEFLRKKHHVAIERWAHAELGLGVEVKPTTETQPAAMTQ